jgi:DNA-binding NarL/FixJ family response regulator
MINKSIRVFIVDDHPMVIEGMTSILQQTPSIEVAGYAMTAASCLGFFVSQTADVVLLDINLPDMSGIDLCKVLKQKFSSLRILGISNFNQGSYVQEMMKQGASGYVLKNASKEELVGAIHKVNQGNQYLSPDAGQAMRREVERQKEIPLITKREREVLALIAQGLTNLAIAEKLFISTSTVDSHRKSLLAKLDAKNTATLISYALSNHIIGNNQ